jgi:hypothetical protein
MQVVSLFSFIIILGLACSWYMWSLFYWVYIVNTWRELSNGLLTQHFHIDLGEVLIKFLECFILGLRTSFWLELFIKIMNILLGHCECHIKMHAIHQFIVILIFLLKIRKTFQFNLW